jgi:hypothetical protein
MSVKGVSICFTNEIVAKLEEIFSGLHTFWCFDTKRPQTVLQSLTYRHGERGFVWSVRITEISDLLCSIKRVEGTG